MITLEIGVGQEVVLAGQVTIQQAPDGAYTTLGNVPVKVKLRGKGWQDYALKTAE